MSVIATAAATMLANAAEKLVELTEKLDALATDRRLRAHIIPIREEILGVREEILRVKELGFEAKETQLQAMTALQQEHAELQNAHAELQNAHAELQNAQLLPDQQPSLEPLQEQILALLANGGGCHLIHISGHIKAGDELLRFHLTELVNMGMLTHSCDTWSIAQPGRRYLLSRNRLP